MVDTLKAAEDVFVISDLHLGGRGPSTGVNNKQPSPDFRMCGEVGQKNLICFLKWLRELASSETVTAIHLVVNGDFIDFLAERDGDTGPFSSFTDEEKIALKKLNRIMNRQCFVDELNQGKELIAVGDCGSAEIFDAFRDFLQKDRAKLTVLLGNHDLELSWPTLETALRERLKCNVPEKAERLTLVTNGRGLRIGKLWIEHGNRYDTFNRVNYHGLERTVGRPLEANGARKPPPPKRVFAPPRGSDLVVDCMNPLKMEYPFVDLLKPERETVIPLLWLLMKESDRRGSLLTKLILYSIGLEALIRETNLPSAPKKTGPATPVTHTNLKENLQGNATDVDFEKEGALALLRDNIGLVKVDADAQVAIQLTLDKLKEFIKEERVESSGKTGFFSTVGAILKLRTVDSRGVGKRLKEHTIRPAEEMKDIAADVAHVLRCFYVDRETRLHIDEPLSDELTLIRKIAREQKNRVEVVVCGHTHLMKKKYFADINITYINTGTWADLILVPDTVFSSNSSTVPSDEFVAFLSGLADGSASRVRLPSFARIRVEVDGSVARNNIHLYIFRPESQKLEILDSLEPDFGKLKTIWQIAQAI